MPDTSQHKIKCEHCNTPGEHVKYDICNGRTSKHSQLWKRWWNKNKKRQRGATSTVPAGQKVFIYGNTRGRNGRWERRFMKDTITGDGHPEKFSTYGNAKKASRFKTKKRTDTTQKIARQQKTTSPWCTRIYKNGNIEVDARSTVIQNGLALSTILYGGQNKRATIADN